MSESSQSSNDSSDYDDVKVLRTKLKYVSQYQFKWPKDLDYFLAKGSDWLVQKKKLFKIDRMVPCLLYYITGFAKLSEKTLKNRADFECNWKIKQYTTDHWSLILTIITACLFRDY